jgi:uroporphyrinogen decarboxylase
MKPLQRFVNACKNLEVDHPPVWIMRQAGRALPEYQALRKKHSFWEICKSPELAAIASLQPVKRFPLDACIIFSDILVVPQAMGMKVKFAPHVTLSPAVSNRHDVSSLAVADISRELGYVAKIIKNVRSEVGDRLAVLGFSGAPFTLATYMIEGQHGNNFSRTKSAIYNQPALFKNLLEKISDAVADYLQMQVEEKVTAVQLFDTWAGELAPEDYERFVLPGLQKIVARVARKGTPLIYYVNGIGNLLELAKKSGADVLGIDWRVKLSEVRKRLGKRQPVQGNLDPHLLLAPGPVIKKRVFEMLDQTRGKGHIVNLGHGLLPQTPLDSISTFIKSVRKWSGTEK